MLYEVITTLSDGETRHLEEWFIRKDGPLDEQIGEGFHDVRVIADRYCLGVRLLVITSYSIHYTKLYDGADRLRPLCGTDGVGQLAGQPVRLADSAGGAEPGCASVAPLGHVDHRLFRHHPCLCGDPRGYRLASKPDQYHGQRLAYVQRNNFV